MNPITRLLRLPQNENRQAIVNMANNLSNGVVDAKTECLRMFNSMNREQRRRLLNAFPAFAKKQGMSDSNINAFMQEVNV